MNSNVSIYRRLNPRLLVQAELGLGLLHWANMSHQTRHLATSVVSPRQHHVT